MDFGGLDAADFGAWTVDEVFFFVFGGGVGFEFVVAEVFFVFCYNGEFADGPRGGAGEVFGCGGSVLDDRHDGVSGARRSVVLFGVLLP